MADKKQKNEEQDDIVYEKQTESVGEDKLVKKIESLKRELKECKEQKKSLQNSYQKLQLDVIKIRKDFEDDIKLSRQKSTAELVLKFIPIFDSLDMAVQDTSFKDAPDAIKSGIENVKNNFTKLLEELGVEFVGEENQDFDPNFHEAISHQATKDKSLDNKIAKVYQKGLVVEGKVIRPAKVSVYNLSADAK